MFGQDSHVETGCCFQQGIKLVLWTNQLASFVVVMNMMRQGVLRSLDALELGAPVVKDEVDV